MDHKSYPSWFIQNQMILLNLPILDLNSQPMLQLDLKIRET